MGLQAGPRTPLPRTRRSPQGAELTGSVLILGSATPDLVTYHRAQKGEYRLLSLPTRVGRRRARDGSHLITDLPMPAVQVVDMRAELRSGNHSIFSRGLQSALDATLGRREQAILTSTGGAATASCSAGSAATCPPASDAMCPWCSTPTSTRCSATAATPTL